MADYTLSAKITGDATEFEKAFNKAQNTVSSFEQRISGIGKSITSVGDKLTSKITKPAFAAGAALTGVTLGKGWARMSDIDNAKVKLKAIGNTAEKVSEIMNNASVSVKGTAYGLNEAATTAASAVAAGIAPGQELEKYLTAVADAAAVAEKDMFSMGAIFNKVTTQGKATNEVLQQMAEAGIPIYQYLADEIGCTAGEIYEMASEGEISLAAFQASVENHIGGAAKTIGSQTISGEISNIGAAISRIGANFLGSADDASSFAGQVLPVLSSVRESLGIVEEKATEWGAKLGQAFSDAVVKIQEVKAKFDELAPSAQSAAIKAIAVGAALSVGIGPGLSVLGKGITAASKTFGMFEKTTRNVSKLEKSLGSIPSVISKVGSSFKSGVAMLGNIKDAILLPFQDMSAGILKLFDPAIEGIQEKFQSGLGGKLVSIISGAGSKIGGVISKVTSKISGLASSVGGVFGKIGSTVATYAGTIGDAFAPILQKAAAFLPTFVGYMNMAAVVGIIAVGFGLLYSQFGTQIDEILLLVQTKGPQIITEFCNGIVLALPNLITQGAAMIIGLMNAITANIPSVITGGISIVTALISGISSQLPEMIPAAVNMVVTFASSLIGNAGQIVDAGLNLINGLVNGFLNALPLVIDSAPEIIGKFVSSILSNLPKILQTGIDIISKLAVGLITAIPQLVSKIPQIVSAIRNAFTSINWGEVGRNIVSGIANGLSGAAGAIVSAAVSAAKSALNAAKRFLGIKSPSTVFRDEVGEMMAQGMGIGFEDNIPVRDMNASIAQAMNRLDINRKEIGMDLNMSYLAHGTDNWQGGFAYMNEGGRGELTYLPNGTQVIPHDISVKYAKEAARNNTVAEPIDMSGFMEGMVIQIVNNTSIDGTPLKESISDYTIRKIGSQQRAARRSKGA